MMRVFFYSPSPHFFCKQKQTFNLPFAYFFCTVQCTLLLCNKNNISSSAVCSLSVAPINKGGEGRLALSGARTHQQVESDGGGGSVGLDVNNEWMTEGGENNHILIGHTYEAVSSTQLQLNSVEPREERKRPLMDGGHHCHCHRHHLERRK